VADAALKGPRYTRYTRSTSYPTYPPYLTYLTHATHPPSLARVFINASYGGQAGPTRPTTDLVY
jgi:hypothetical protein